MTNKINEIERVDFDTLEAGSRVKSWCGKCKDFREHTVQAKNNIPGKSPKSICRTCQAVHMVRFHRPGSSKPKVKVVKIDPATSWPEQVEGVEVEEWKIYQISESFTKNDFVEHRKYGKGKVLRVAGKYRVKILFKDGIKLMLQNK